MLLQDKQKIVFTGDSVTDAGRKRPIGEGIFDGGSGSGYVRLIESFLNIYYPEMIVHVVNTGVSGDNSSQLLARFDTDMIDLKPDYGVICIGFNDVWRYFDEPSLFEYHVSLEQYRGNIVEMVNRMKAAGIKPMFMTPYYVEANKQDAMRVMMESFRDAMKSVAKEFDLPILDLQPKFDELLKYRYPAYVTWDRIHPNHPGSMLIAVEFLKFIGFDFDRLKK